MDDDEPEFDYLSAKGPSPSNGIRPSSIVGAKCAKSAGSSQSSSPVDPVDTKVRVKSEASSEETSNSSTPGRQQSPWLVFSIVFRFIFVWEDFSGSCSFMLVFLALHQQVA